MFNKLITLLLPFMPKRLVWIFSKKYIAGETIDDAVKVCKELNAQGIKDHHRPAGEFITNLVKHTKTSRNTCISSTGSRRRKSTGTTP